MKKFVALISTIAFLFTFSSGALAANSANDILVYQSDDSKVKTYMNQITGEYYSDLSFEDFDPGDEIVLFEDNETGNTISILYENFEPAINTRASGSSGWSAGYLPDGNSTLTPNITGPTGIYISYKVDVSAYPVYISGTRSPVITGLGATVHSYNHRVVYSSPTSAHNASAEMEFNISYTQSGVNPGSMVGYLNVEINSDGQVRTSWQY